MTSRHLDTAKRQTPAHNGASTILIPPTDVVQYTNEDVGSRGMYKHQAWAEGKGALALCRHCADCGQEPDCIYVCSLVVTSIGRIRVMNKQKKKKKV